MGGIRAEELVAPESRQGDRDIAPRELHQPSGRAALGLSLAATTVLLWSVLPIGLKITLEVLDPLTLSWIRSNLESRSPASVEICTLLRKPDAAKVEVDVKWVGFDIPNEFVVGYGLDYAEAYRGLRVVGTLAPHVYS